MATAEPARKLFALTDLADENALWLEMEGQIYEVVSFTASFACNEVPTAQCMLAVGRLARDGTPAAAHYALDMKQMLRANVWFYPKGEYSPTGKKWPGKAFKVFDGYYMGFAYRKLDGKTMVMVNLTHWLIDLSLSSTMSANSHPSNPWQMTAQAVMTQFKAPAGAGLGANAKPVYLSDMTLVNVYRQKVALDFWEGTKVVFTCLATTKAMATSLYCQAGNGGMPAHNSRASRDNRRAWRAIRGIEGAGDTGTQGDVNTTFKGEGRPASQAGYDYAVPLKFETHGWELVAKTVGDSLANQTVSNFANHTFWDKLVS